MVEIGNLIAMERTLRHGRPNKSVLAGIATHILFNHEIPSEAATCQVLAFSNLFLCQIDNQGDRENHKLHRSRSFMDTGKMYYRGFFLSDDQKDFDESEIEDKIDHWLTKNNLNYQAVNDWVKANWVWEHLAGGGDQRQIPDGWKKYLKALGEWPWTMRTDDEKTITYRWATNWYFSRAFTATLGVMDENLDKQTKPICVFANIYQITTDDHHSKNLQEPLYVRAIDTIKSRDPDWSKAREAMLIAESFNIHGLLGLAGYAIADILSRLSKTEEWNCPPTSS